MFHDYIATPGQARRDDSGQRPRVPHGEHHRKAPEPNLGNEQVTGQLPLPFGTDDAEDTLRGLIEYEIGLAGVVRVLLEIGLTFDEFLAIYAEGSSRLEKDLAYAAKLRYTEPGTLLFDDEGVVRVVRDADNGRILGAQVLAWRTASVEVLPNYWWEPDQRLLG